MARFLNRPGAVPFILFVSLGGLSLVYNASAIASYLWSAAPQGNAFILDPGHYWEQFPEKAIQDGPFTYKTEGTTLVVYPSDQGTLCAVEFTTWEIYYLNTGGKDPIKVGGYSSEWRYTERARQSLAGNSLHMLGMFQRRQGLELGSGLGANIANPKHKQEYISQIENLRNSYKTSDTRITVHEDKIVRVNTYNGDPSLQETSSFVPKR